MKALPENIFFLDIIKDLPSNIDYDMSMYISKIDAIKALNDITFNIASYKGELATISKNQRNVDVINKAKEDAILLRQKLQVENQEVYNISFLITFYSWNLIQLNKIISSIKSKFYSKGIVTESTNFIQLDFYLTNLPLNINNNYLNKMYITTDGLANIFPFYTENIVDKGGIIIGNTSKSRICMIDIFSKSYENANMCIFGCSGSGKSFFTKLFIIRSYFKDIRQIILDAEGEYEKLSINLEGQIILNHNTFFNILEITKKDMEYEDYLESKVKRIVEFITMFCNIDGDYLKYKLYEVYSKFNITENKQSVMLKEDGENIYLDGKIKNSNDFPTLEDLLEMLDEDKKHYLLEAINTTLYNFSKVTNINLESPLYILNMKKILDNPPLVSYILNFIVQNYTGDKNTIIYIDELWKYAKSEEVLNQIFNMYKTIRKRKASIVTITQDITDFFEHNSGTYARSILNNSCFKMFFKTSYKDIERYMDTLYIANECISYLKKAEALLIINKNNIKLKINSNELERGIIDEDDNSSR